MARDRLSLFSARQAREPWVAKTRWIGVAVSIALHLVVFLALEIAGYGEKEEFPRPIRISLQDTSFEPLSPEPSSEPETIPPDPVEPQPLEPEPEPPEPVVPDELPPEPQPEPMEASEIVQTETSQDNGDTSEVLFTPSTPQQPSLSTSTSGDPFAFSSETATDSQDGSESSEIAFANDLGPRDDFGDVSTEGQNPVSSRETSDTSQTRAQEEAAFADYSAIASTQIRGIDVPLFEFQTETQATIQTSATQESQWNQVQQDLMTADQIILTDYRSDESAQDLESRLDQIFVTDGDSSDPSASRDGDEGELGPGSGLAGRRLIRPFDLSPFLPDTLSTSLPRSIDIRFQVSPDGFVRLSNSEDVAPWPDLRRALSQLFLTGPLFEPASTGADGTITLVLN